MRDSAISFSPTVLSALRALMGAMAGVLVVLALAVAALAAAGVGLLVALASLAVRAVPGRGARRETAGPAMLEGRRTAQGWVVETGAH